MKNIAIISLVFASLLLVGCQEAHAEGIDVGRLADAIYKAENSVRYPYGIKSINTHGDMVYARRICINTIKNNIKRWQVAGCPKEFIEFLGDRYCPKADDPKGHKVWARNVKSLYLNTASTMR